jgi:hypothetical protein
MMTFFSGMCQDMDQVKEAGVKVHFLRLNFYLG